MSCYKNENLIEEAIHVLAMEGFEALPKLVSRLMNEAMLIERERHLNASPYERVLPLYNVGYITAGTPKSLTFSQN